jgi:hypothetical protein
MVEAAQTTKGRLINLFKSYILPQASGRGAPLGWCSCDVHVKWTVSTCEQTAGYPFCAKTSLQQTLCLHCH